MAQGLLPSAQYSGSGGFTSFARYAGVYAPNAAKQALSANTNTTIVLNTEVRDDDSIASVTSNQVTIASAGTYYLEARVPWQADSAGYDEALIQIYDVTNSRNVISEQSGGYIGRTGNPFVIGDWYKITGSTVFEVRFEGNGAGKIGSIYTGTGLTNATASLAMRGQLFVGKK